MKLHLNRETLNNEFKVKNDLDQKVRLTHTSGPKGKKLLPYTASDNVINKYQALLGNFSREVSLKKYEEFDKESFFKSIEKNVESKESDKFLTIINELFFDEQGELVMSHPFFFNYLEEGGNNEKKVALFLKEVLASSEIIDKVSKLYNERPNNVLLSLLYASLPALEEKTKREESKEYVCILPEIKELFKEDLLFLLEDNELLISHFKDLILYYYLFYTTQLILDLDRMFAEKKEKVYPVYFNVSWETRSKTRDSFKQGWKMVSAKLSKLFAHINCLAMLNHMENDEYPTVTYDHFKELVSSLSGEQQEEIAVDIKQLNKDYQSYLGDVDWAKIKRIYSFEEQDDALKSVEELFHSISFQFQKKISSRSRAAERYYEGYLEFVKRYFLKQSGSLGYTFNLSQDQVIFLTKLCIKGKKKMPLRELFIQMEERGVFFDRDSRRHVTELFERLNILEKKSDSGDAQYVKYIL